MHPGYSVDNVEREKKGRLEGENETGHALKCATNAKQVVEN